MISTKLEIALVMAIREAKSHKHEHVTVEHILYGLLHDEFAVKIIRGCGASTQNIKEKLDQFFEKELESREGVKLLSPYFELNRKTVWGATAMMLSEVKDLFEYITRFKP